MIALNNLNLARKYRPTILDDVVGQSEPLRMLSNSLYLGRYFPVYLFSGQRGCGKTSTARIFSRALNCSQLGSFQQDPRNAQIPCQTCQSCRAMDDNQHPDFIEIDGASNTGVDNVRSIIEAANYVPLLGHKKIYLIDEAHMLSKAAFNAFLKILEEPPVSVIFMLATTELYKIPPTVVSRCFHVVFKPLKNNDLVQLIQDVARREGFQIDDAASLMIAEDAEGSARDALNLLEKIRLYNPVIDRELVMRLLHKVDHESILALLTALIDQKPADLLPLLKRFSAAAFSVDSTWNSVSASIRAMMWTKYAVEPAARADLPQYEHLVALAERASVGRLQGMMQLMLHYEPLFLKSMRKEVMLETTLLMMCHQVAVDDIHTLLDGLKGGSDPRPSVQKKVQHDADADVVAEPVPSRQDVPVHHHAKVHAAAAVPAPDHVPAVTPESIGPWEQFVVNMQHQDPVLHAIFAQARCRAHEDQPGVYRLQLKHDNLFIRDTIESKKLMWQPLVQAVMHDFSSFLFESQDSLPVKRIEHVEKVVEKKNMSDNHQEVAVRQRADVSRGQASRAVDLKNKDRWPRAHLILSIFPGTIKRKVYN